MSPHPHETPCQISFHSRHSQSRGRQTSKPPRPTEPVGLLDFSRAFTCLLPCPHEGSDVLLQKFMLPLEYSSHYSLWSGQPSSLFSSWGAPQRGPPGLYGRLLDASKGPSKNATRSLSASIFQAQAPCAACWHGRKEAQRSPSARDIQRAPSVCVCVCARTRVCERVGGGRQRELGTGSVFLQFITHCSSNPPSKDRDQALGPLLPGTQNVVWYSLSMEWKKDP